jgi:hypothetical protein
MPFAGIRTDRLLLREVRNSDADDLVRRRNDAEVSEYQDWTTPYPRASADEVIAETIALGGPTPDEWYMLTVANADDTTVHGDVVVHLSADGHTAEIGPEAIRLVEITPETIHRVAELQTHRTQRRFVSPVLNSFRRRALPRGRRWRTAGAVDAGHRRRR